jgi:hypothetical protein
MPVSVTAISHAAGDHHARLRRAASISERSNSSEDLACMSWDDVIETLPLEDERLGEIVVELKRLNAQGLERWEPRRLICTSSSIIFAKPGGDKSIDAVPLLHVADLIAVRLGPVKDFSEGFSEVGEGPGFPEMGNSPKSVEGNLDNTVATRESLNDQAASTASPSLSRLRRASSVAFTGLQNLTKGKGQGTGFNIITTSDSHHAGRIYTLRAASEVELAEWLDVVQHAKKVAVREALEKTSRIARLQAQMRVIYDSHASQIFFALIILCAFAVSLSEAELQVLCLPHSVHGEHLSVFCTARRSIS